jgi:hypothetical protein
MKKFSILAFVFAFNASYALDPMYNYRYTLGPEILIPGAFHAGAGFWTHYNEDGVLSFNAQIGIVDAFEIGAKYMAGTDERWLLTGGRHSSSINNHIIDVGAKYAITPNVSLQADIPMAINKDWNWGGVVSLTSGDGYTKNIFFIYEGRLGFGGASGPDNRVKASGAFVPYFHIGNAFRLSVCTLASFSFQNIKDDFMVDMMPRVEAGFKSFRIMGEVSLGILSWKAERYNRYAAFVVSDI